MIFIFFQGQLYGFITVQQEIPSHRSGIKKLMEKDYIGGNGIKQGLSRNLRVTLLQNDSEKETLTRRKQRVDAIKSKTTPPLKVTPCDGSSPETESDPTEENDAMYHWTKEQLLVLLVFCVTMGIIFGCTLGIIFGCSLRSLLLSLKNSNCNYFMLQRRKEFRRHRKNTKFEVDSSK